MVIFTQICKNMNKKKLTIECRHYETLTFVIKIIYRWIIEEYVFA